MISINKLTINNYLSYGEGVEIDFSGNKVTQIIGENGSGKSSIHIILEELLYNKNSKKLSKKELKNRYSTGNHYGGSVEFDIGSDSYVLTKVVKSTTSVKLLENGSDISGHTATQTYKKLEGLLGINFATFSKMVNQSLLSSLDFLALTDAKRKEFLVDFLGLNEYQDIGKSAKSNLSTKTAVLTSKQTELGKLKTDLATLHKTLENYDASTKPQPIPPTPVMADTSGITEEINTITKRNSELENEYRTRQREIERIERTNREQVERSASLVAKREDLIYTRDNLYAEVFIPRSEANFNTTKLNELQKLFTEAKQRYDDNAKMIAVYSKDVAKTNCQECGHELDKSDVSDMLAEKVAQKDRLALKCDTLEFELLQEKANKDACDLQKLLYSKVDGLDKQIESIELSEPVLEEVPETLDPPVLESVSHLKIQIDEARTNYEADLREYEATRAAHDSYSNKEKEHSKLLGNQETIMDRLSQLTYDIVKETKEVEALSVIAEALSSKGIINHKIATLMSSISVTINEYLAELSNGRYQLVFHVSDTKLGISLHYQGEEVSITSLSSGEYAIVQVATLLGIRKTLARFSDNKINLLFLDEVISVLDDDRKPALVELLNKERDLVSLIVSHSYRHPFARAMFVVKENDISRITYDG